MPGVQGKSGDQGGRDRGVAIVEIERLSVDRCSREVWRFEVSSWGDKFILDFYGKETRPTPRHKWKDTGAKTRWSRLNNRDHWNGFGMKDEDVPVPAMVVSDALKKLVAKMTVVLPGAEE
jgi:hypothetical protein